MRATLAPLHQPRHLRALAPHPRHDQLARSLPLLTNPRPSPAAPLPRRQRCRRRQAIPLNHTMVQNELQSLGYATAMIGKWHVGYVTHELLYTYINRVVGGWLP